MVSILLIFVASSFISFIGSLQLGPVNLYVINTVLYQNKKAAFFVAIGGCIPEFIYCGLAVYANHFIQESITINYSFKIAFILILITISVLFFFKKKSAKISLNSDDTNYQSNIKSVLKGFSLAAFNPQLLPFWIFILIYFNSVSFLSIITDVQRFSFILGAGVGAFVLLITLTALVHKYKTSILKYMNTTYYYKVLSILFLLIAIQQLISLIQL